MPESKGAGESGATLSMPKSKGAGESGATLSIPESKRAEEARVRRSEWFLFAVLKGSGFVHLNEGSED